MKVIITGTSGMVGRGVLLECLDDHRIEGVLILNRKSIGVSHPKLRELIVPDFFEIEKVKQELSGYGACYFCLGVSAFGLSEESYTKITYDLTTNFATVYLEQNPDSVFCYVSGAGTNSQGKFMWARVKGKTEDDLLNMKFKRAYMFRPGYIQPMRGIKSRTNWFSIIFYAVFSPLYLILKHFPTTATNSINMGKAMIKVALEIPELNVLENKEINEQAK